MTTKDWEKLYATLNGSEVSVYYPHGKPTVYTDKPELVNYRYYTVYKFGDYKIEYTPGAYDGKTSGKDMLFLYSKNSIVGSLSYNTIGEMIPDPQKAKIRDLYIAIQKKVAQQQKTK